MKVKCPKCGSENIDDIDNYFECFHPPSVYICLSCGGSFIDSSNKKIKER